MKSTALFITGISLLLPPVLVRADLGPIVITPTRTAQEENTSSATVYVVTRAQIEASNAATTSQLLRGIPGVQIDDLFGNGTDVTVSVRGFSSTANANTLVLVNGRRLNNSDTATPDLHHIFPKDIERIEVLVGSAGSLYGDQAVGGVINIITRGTERNRHRVSSRVGSYDTRGVQVNSSMQLTDELAYRLSAETFDSDHYRDNNSEENSNFSGLLDYVRGDSRLYLEVQEIRDELELPGALIESEVEEDREQSNASFEDDFIDEDTSVRRIGYELDFDEQRFSIDATRRETDADLRQSIRNNPSPEDGVTRRENRSLNPKLAGNFDTGLSVPYVVGIDLEETDYDLEVPNAFGVRTSSNEQTTESLYFQLNPQLTEAMQLTFGMRRSSVENDIVDLFGFPDGVEVDDDITVNELGLAYRLDAQTRLTARIDENFRFAKVNELAGAAMDVILDTQTGESFELGIDLTRGDQQIIASLYRLDLEDEIEFDPVAFVNFNLDETRRDGMTLSWLSQIDANLALRVDIGLVDARFESGPFDGNEVSGVSDEIARLRGDYRINDFFSTFIEWQYSSPRYAQGDNGNEFGRLDSITVINAGLGYEYKAWQARFRVNNLADEEYSESVNNFGAFFPSPERNFSLALGYTFE